MYCSYILPINTSSLALPNGFWTIELDISGLDAVNMPDTAINETLKYKEEGLPPYPLAVPNGTSFHCSNATYCVEDRSDRSRCDRDKLRVRISRLQVCII